MRRDDATAAETAQLLEQVGLGSRSRATVAALSHGEQRQLEIAMALATRPRLLLLDEPAAGLSAAEILGRTRGSVGWGLFYGLFVLAAATHGAIGVRVVASEWLGLGARQASLLMWGVGLLLAVLGLRAVAAVVL